jgi:hypothetical protein
MLTDSRSNHSSTHGHDRSDRHDHVLRRDSNPLESSWLIFKTQHISYVFVAQTMPLELPTQVDTRRETTEIDSVRCLPLFE